MRADPLVWKSFEVAGVGASYLVTGQSTGRFIRIQRNTTGPLHLAEVAVYGAATSVAADYELNPAIYGEWSDVIEWPHIPVHAGLLPSGKILSYDATPDDFQPILNPVASPNNTTRASIWNYLTGIHQDAGNNTGDDLFCSGHTTMSSGDYFAAGGTTGYNAAISSTNIFESDAETWIAGPKMAFARWYPTVTNMASGELFIAGGGGPLPEVYNPDDNTLRTLNGVTRFGTAWPFIMQAPNGRMLHAGGARARTLAFIDTAGDGSMSLTSSTVVDRNRASFVVYDIGQMMVSGGVGGRNSVNLIEMNNATVRDAAPMNLPRQDHNSVALPNGQVIVIGGNQVGGFCGDESASYAPEIWTPSTGSWQMMAAQQHPRQYHSTAVLLPDGRVWSGGQGYATVVSTQVALCSYQNSAEIFSPPYLFNRDGTPADRPVITAAPEQISHDSSFTVHTPNANDIASVSLIRLSTATHATNFSQRFIPLNFSRATASQLLVESPLDSNIAPAGYYMLFILNNNGTPGIANMVKVTQPGPSQMSYQLDFGTADSPVAAGWIGISPQTHTELFSWGLATPNSVDRGNANNISADRQDLVYLNRETQMNINVGNGTWRVTMILGDTANYTHDRIGVSAEGRLIHADINSNRGAFVFVSENGTSATETSFDVKVTDGSLTLILTDNGGVDQNWVVNGIRLELIDDVDNAPVIAPVTVSPGPAGQAVAYSVAANGVGQISYSWNFGDGTAATAFSNSHTTSHRFPGAGRYNVTVTARDDTNTESTHTFTQIIYAPPTTAQPVSSSSILELATQQQIWNVNPDNDTVTVINRVTAERVMEIPVDAEPVSLAVSPAGQLWVTNKAAATISVIDPQSTTVSNTFYLPAGSRPHGIVFGHDAAFVALEATGSVAVLSLQNGEIVDQHPLGSHPRHLTLSADKRLLYVSRFITPKLPMEHTGSPITEDQNGYYGGEVLVLETDSLRELPGIVLRYSDRPASDVTGPGIPNYLGPVAISPDGTFAWVPSKQDNIINGEFRTGDSLRFDQTVRAIVSKIDLATGTEDPTLRIDHDNASISSHATFDAYGTFLFTTLEGNRQVAVSDANANHELFRFDVGRAPQGIARSADNNRLYVHNFMDRTVGIYDISTLVNGGELAVAEIATVTTVANEQLDPQVLHGKSLFYDARDDRLAAFDYMACASCHNDGSHDGRVWDFTQMGEGLRNTTTLRGRRGTGHGFVHWTANFDEIQDFEGQIRAFAGGAGLMSDAQFAAGTRADPLGDRKAGISADLDALAAYVESLSAIPPSPFYLDAEASNSAQSLFVAKGCISCHTSPDYTDSADGSNLHDIGTLRISSGNRATQALNRYRYAGADRYMEYRTLSARWLGRVHRRRDSGTQRDNDHQGRTRVAGDVSALGFLSAIGRTTAGDRNHGRHVSAGNLAILCKFPAIK